MSPRFAVLGVMSGAGSFLTGLWLLVSLLAGHWAYGLAAVLLVAGAALTVICFRVDDRRPDDRVPRDR